MKRVLVFVLTVLLSRDLIAQEGPASNLKSQLASAAIGARLKVKLKSGDVVRGRLSSVDQNDFTIMVGRRKTGLRTISFLDAESAAVEGPTHTPVAAWIATGAIAAVVVIVITIFVIERHNEGG